MSDAMWSRSGALLRRPPFLPHTRRHRLAAIAYTRWAADWVAYPFLLDILHAIDRAVDDPAAPLVRAWRWAQDSPDPHATGDWDVWELDQGVRLLFKPDFGKFDLAAIGAACRRAVLPLGPAYCCEYCAGGTIGPSLFQADMAADVFPVTPSPSFDPAWRTSTTVGLAQAIYARHAFHDLSILADALQEVGCDTPELLAHCRDTSLTHVRGCWAVDLVLGKS